jgi:hypothetical protein
MMARWTILGLTLVLGSPLAGQQPTRPAPPPAVHVVRGAVYDSVARGPLVGAVVQIAERDAAGPVFSVVTDSTGHFRIADVPAGHFLIGFYHEALTVLGLDAPFRPLDLAGDSTVTVDIAVPSGAVVHALRCGGDSALLRRGMLAGFVRDAVRGSPLAGAAITVEWRAIAFDPGNYRTITQQAAATVSDDGTYRLCALPGNAPLTLRASAPGYHGVAAPIEVPTAGVARQDLRLADSSALRGAASIRGRVVHENGNAVRSGRAAIAALGRDVPVRDGAFILSELPVGTWVVTARAVGVDAKSAIVDVAGSGTTSTTITMSDRAQPLDAVTVVGAPSRETRVLDELLFRKRFGAGTVFLPGNPFLQGANRATDVLRAARGFSPKPNGGYYGRAVQSVSCEAAGKCKVTPRCDKIRVYVNGERLLDGLENLDNAVVVREVIGIEAYPDLAFAPPEWRFSGGDGACAIVAVWTRGGPR